MNINYKLPEEWFNQADYDFVTAKAMLDTGRYIYTKKLKENPSKTHNLNYICEEMNFEIPGKFQDFMDNLNNLSVPTRYPEKLEKLVSEFKKDVTQKIYNQTGELLRWLKETEG